MSGLNANYLITPPLQDYFVNKTTGLPLAGGQVYFYQDNSRSTLMPVYELTDLGGGNYEYTALPNPMTLSSVGTAQDDDGNDVVIYLYPYVLVDGEPVFTLYFIETYDSSGNFQWSRSAFPNLTEESGGGSEIAAQNFISNGQFLLHDNYFVPTTTSTVIGQVAAGFNIVAPGNWYYENSSGSTDVDTVTWSRFNTFVTAPANSPRYAANIQCITPGSATFKHFGVRFYDVNKFSSATQTYTFSASVISTTAATLQVWTRKNFGTGGSPSASVSTNIGALAVNTSYPTTQQSFSFVFGDNSAYSIGTNNNDYVDIYFQLPFGVAFNFSITDVMLIEGTVNPVSFPATTNNEFLIEGLLGSIPVPDYTGLNYYLPIINTPSGFSYATNEVGKVYARPQAAPFAGELLCDGSTYLYNNISSDLIPYSRLGNALWNSTYSNYTFGGGPLYVTAQIDNANTNNLIFSSNQVGTTGNTAAPMDGTTTGLSYQVVCSAQSSNYAVRVGYQGITGLLVIGTVQGAVTAPAAGTSGFNIQDLRNSSLFNHQFLVVPVVSGSLQGLYWTFANTVANYYVWYKVNGAGVDPAPSGSPTPIGIPVNLPTSYTVADVSSRTAAALLGEYCSTITCPNVAGIAAGSYFTFGTIPYKFYAWFSISGSGSDPALSGYTASIKISLTTGGSAANVVSAIISSVNKVAYGVPNYQGLFLRGADPLLTWDYNSTRGPQFNDTNNQFANNSPGTFEIDSFADHLHTTGIGYATASGTSEGFIRGGTILGENTYTTDQTITNAPGLSETVPVNSYVNWFIKY